MSGGLDADGFLQLKDNMSGGLDAHAFLPYPDSKGNVDQKL